MRIQRGAVLLIGVILLCYSVGTFGFNLLYENRERMGELFYQVCNVGLVIISGVAEIILAKKYIANRVFKTIVFGHASLSMLLVLVFAAIGQG